MQNHFKNNQINPGRMQRLILLCVKILPIYFIIALCSCATIFTGIDQAVLFTSEQDSVKLYINGEYKGITPIICHVRKSIEYDIIIQARKYNYRMLEFALDRKFEWLSLFNLPFNGGVGLMIDMASGAVIRYNDHTHIKLDSIRSVNNE